MFSDHRVPEIVTLCGSTRFGGSFRKAQWDWTLRGKIVLSIGVDTHSDEALGVTVADKQRLDALHFRKIDLSDFVFVINEDDYIGESTSNEIAYARSIGVPVYYMFEHTVEVVDGKARGCICENGIDPVCPADHIWNSR